MIKIYKNVKVPNDVHIGEFSIIGKPSRPHKYTNKDNPPIKTTGLKTSISKGCYIGTHVLIEEDVKIGQDCVIESKSVIEKGTIIGKNSFIVHGAWILQNVSISENCIIAGLVSEDSIIGDNCRIFGSLLHKQVNPNLPWDENIEPSPILSDNVIVGIGAKVIGSVKINRNVFICSNAIVTKDIPSFSIVKSTNNIIPFREWKGELVESLFWRE